MWRTVGRKAPCTHAISNPINNNCNTAIDEGCHPTNVDLIFPSAVVSGTTQSGMQVMVTVGMPGIVGNSPAAAPENYSVDWGFYYTLP